MARERRKFSPQFKAEVALAALKGDKTLPKIASMYDLTTAQVSRFRQLAVQRMPKLFLEERATRKASSFEYQIEDRVYANLTPREQEVLEIVVKGLNQREAAEVLGISSRTVEVHKRRIMAKLHVSSVAELIRLVLKGDRPKRELRG